MYPNPEIYEGDPDEIPRALENNSQDDMEGDDGSA